MSSAPPPSAKPDIVPVDDLLESVMAGEIRVPRFQRPYVWSPDDMVQLFDSVLKGYPVGSLLMWQTDRPDISSLDAIGPILLPPARPGQKSYVVDGHQRLATLLGVLYLPEGHPKDKLEDWRWWIAYDLRLEQFVHLKDRAKSVPLHLLPLRNVLRTVDFARRTREIAGSKDFSESEATSLLNRADAVQRSIRNYRIPLTVLRSGSLDDAVTIFARVNQRGRDMTPDQMVSALTFRDKDEGDFNIAAAIDDILGELRTSGFGDLERRIILQIILAAADLDFTRPSYERMVNRDSHAMMRPAVKRARTSLLKSAEFLKGELSLKTSRLLPYASIIVMLAIYFDEIHLTKESVSRTQANLIKKWFWATSFNGWFAGANTTDLRQAGEMMRALARRDIDSTARFESFFLNRPIRPFPETFDRRSARVRASLLVQMIVGKPREPINGGPIDVSAVFTDVAARDIPYFFPNQRRPAVSNPANRVILPEGYPRNARGSFLALESHQNASRILKSHFISDEAFDALKSDDFERFVSLREESILFAESAFLLQFDLSLDNKAERNSDEVDSTE